MKFIILSALLFLSASVGIADEQLLTAKSPEHRVSLLELYTSEGCSSCPPADRFLSGLEPAGVNNQQLIPLEFHVTYWDYIGWKDTYASREYDERQRKIAKLEDRQSVYTPQFVLNGADYRDYASFSQNVRKVILQLADVDIVLNVEKKDQQTNVNLKTNISKSDIDYVVFYLVLYENKLVSYVADGENKGDTLRHDYVVRKVHGPFKQDRSHETESFQQVIEFEPEWKKQDLGIVAYAQNPVTGKVLQAVELKLF